MFRAQTLIPRSLVPLIPITPNVRITKEII